MTEDIDIPAVPSPPEEPDAEGPGPFTYDETSPNMVAAFEAHPEGMVALKKVSSQVKEQFDKCYEHTYRRRREMRMFMRLLTGHLPRKDPPFDQQANAHIPIMIQNMSAQLSRVQDEIFGNWKSVFGATPMGPNEEAITDALSMHGNWQFREEIIDFPTQIQRGQLSYMFGTFRMHSFYDTYNRRNCHESLTDDDLIVPYAYTSTMPDMSDIPFKIKVLRHQRYQLQQMRQDWSHVDEVLKRSKPSWDDQESEGETIRSGIAKAQGEDEPDDSFDSAPYRLLQWEGWMELPEQQNDRYVQAVVDYRSGHVMKLSIHEEVDWKERIRFDREVQESTEYDQQLSAYSAQMLAYEGMADAALNDNDVPGAEQIVGVMESSPAPERPRWMLSDGDRPRKPRKTPINMYVQGNCIELIVGTHGVGPGTYQAQYQRAGNELFSRYLDQAGLANSPSLLATSNVVFKSPFVVAPGRINIVDGVTPEDLQTSIRELNFPPANPQLMDAVDRLQAYGRQSAQVADILLGESGKSGEAYRGQLARLEQATKNLTAFARNFARPLKYVYRNNAILNSKFMDDYELLYLFNDKIGEWQFLPVGRKLYERQYKVEIHSDLKFTSQAQRIADTDEIYTMVMANPKLATNDSLLHEVISDVFKARGKEKLLPLMGKAPEVPKGPDGQPLPFGFQFQQQQQAAAQQQAQQPQGPRRAA